MSSGTNALVGMVALAGCNQLFGSTEVTSAPVAQFDAPLDAPFACAPIGQTPQFSPYIHQFLARDCSFYGVAGTEAIAECDLAGVMTIMQAPIGEELEPAPGIPTSSVPATPRISPDGQTLLARVGTSGPAVVEYARSGDAWVVANPDAFDVTNTGVPFSSIAQIGSKLRVLVVASSSNSVVEYERAAGAWSIVATTPLTQLVGDASFVTGLALTGDGLRLVLATGSETRYSDRSGLGAAFRPSEALQSPSATDVFATDDCARIYLSGLGSVVYAQRL